MTQGNITVPTVTGSIDGMVPVYNPDGRFQIWKYDQVWWGTHGQNRYVPNVGDLVILENSFKEVVDVDEATLIPTLRDWNQTVKKADVAQEDLLIGIGPGRYSDTFRVYIDKSVRPFTLAVDARCSIYGTDVRKIQICKGNELTGKMKVISGLYDNNGTYLGTDVPLELANMRDHTNYATWSIPTCYTNEELEDNEIVQLRVFSADGGLRSKFPLLVENTAFIRLTDDAHKYVTHISLESPFISQADPHRLEYPMNVPIRGLDLFGVVHYNDGSSKRMPVDGTKFQIFGFENFVATQVGERTKLILQYNLSNDEIHYGSTVGVSHAIQENYIATTTKEDGSYSVKLYAYPTWIDEVNGYRLTFYMFNLDRRTWENVTPYVFFNTNMPAFNPRLYGTTQQISVSLDLHKVNPSYKEWRHVQVFDIVLSRNGTDKSGTQWTVAYERNQSPAFGVDNWINATHVSQNVKHLDITCGETNFESWLERLYWRTKPLFSSTREARAPEPNMFAIHVKSGESYEFPIKQWNSQLTINSLMSNEENIAIRFFKRTNDYDLQLSIAAVPVIFTNTRT